MTAETTKKPGNGVLEAYWEQGWEGRIEYCFFPDSAKQQTSRGPQFIKEGQYLRIFAPDGAILWSGKIRFKYRKKWLFFYQRHELPNEIWHDLTQKGVPYKDWIAWFWNGLRAELLCDEPAPVK